ncbi:RloB family protein [Actinomadura sp. DC4]|uniref:RloB family protein n=1 Tax=Actinomadura sp. DC4 TaxID=3055069 RepID=UPI0025B04E86|nr:RloB family protein [Actinomadura sp. DC4]MDN3355874.1 RloB family protein [Actinomadura sp. DC4]
MSGGRNRGQSNLRRRRNSRPERPRVLIVTEGQLTEPQYFKGLARELKATGIEIYKLDITGVGRDPCRVVREAIIRAGLPRIKKGSEDSYEHVWCVIDVDEHTTLEKALMDAQEMSIEVALSNPCFELWLLWHFEDSFAHITGIQLSRKLRGYGFVGKGIPIDFPHVKYASAISRATESAARSTDGPSANPSSSVHKLVSLVAGTGGRPQSGFRV